MLLILQTGSAAGSPHAPRLVTADSSAVRADWTPQYAVVRVAVELSIL